MFSKVFVGVHVLLAVHTSFNNADNIQRQNFSQEHTVSSRQNNYFSTTSQESRILDNNSSFSNSSPYSSPSTLYSQPTTIHKTETDANNSWTTNTSPSPSSTTTTQNTLAPASTTPSSNKTDILNNDDNTNGNGNINGQSDCPSLKGDVDALTQDAFLSILVHTCRYDSLTIPSMNEPLEVAVQLDISHIEVEESYRFKLHLMITFSYMDNRLDYHNLSPKRGPIVGGDILSGRIWTPHIYVPNERSSSLMGFGGKDVYMSINPMGKVVFTERMSVSIYCWMDLKKFPFDEQKCSIYFQTWTYNISKLKLKWEKDDPVTVSRHLHMTEFTLIGYEIYETVNQSIMAHGSYHAGNHSSLIFEFHIAREIGYYIMDYFIPSMLLVVTSWVTFWLQADNAPPRVTLGTSTMLAFITLASGQSKNLPKVSYIKASEIWFLGCTVFIFLSMAEFAFVNVIWRRKKKVELKKMTGKYILKSALTPKLARKELQKEWNNSLNSLHKSHSCSSIVSSLDDKINNGRKQPTYNNYLTVHSLPGINIHEVNNHSDDTLITSSGSGDNVTIPVPNRNNNGQPPSGTFASMTPQEVAIWIDKKSRFIFPCAFLIFNIFYWSFVYAI
ncbi:glycine receptor subunit alpha-2-like [Agrilus planipennis]|uniref:Glycine receptor subunit alpha-2-like n=1 Tax=Agrilus planipennis TaxID=224129 RepID=A0A1W4X0T1_AGRPL|nr:glycine receptor subunit alpha-2-like [Agrilus planipennis]